MDDLFLEHSLLNRILLIYDNQLLEKQPNYIVINSAAKIVRKFIEDHHEQMEEKFIFPLFLAPNVGTNIDTHISTLIKELINQHNIGREITSKIISLTEVANVNANMGANMGADMGDNIDENGGGKYESVKLKGLLFAFIKLYRAHEAFEETVIFKNIHKYISREEYVKLDEKMDEIEDELFGEGGYDKILEQVKSLEETIKIGNLSYYTNITKPILKHVL